MANRDANHARFSAYCHGIKNYQLLLITHLIESERSYTKEQISACRAAIETLNTPGLPEKSVAIPQESRSRVLVDSDG
jgi:hypothetical protein